MRADLHHTKKNFNMRRIFFLALLVSASFTFPQNLLAATLSLSPAKIELKAGETREITVYVSSTDAPINAVSGHISFPKNIAIVSGVSKVGSIISFWASEPTSSNAVGTIDFEGVVFNPGFQGARGKVLSFTVRGLVSGSADFSFSSGSLLANDGLGTDITERLTGATVVVQPKTAPREVTPSLPDSVPQESLLPLVIASATHPDQKIAYTARDAEFSWELPADATAIRLSYGTKPIAEPTVVYVPPISSKKITLSEDGTYYFHAQYKKDGSWSPAAHYRFAVSRTGIGTEIEEDKITAATSTDMSPATTTVVADSIPVEEVQRKEYPKPHRYRFSFLHGMVFVGLLALLTSLFIILLLKVERQNREIARLKRRLQQMKKT